MSYIGNVPTNVAFLTDTFNGTGSTTAFTLSAAPANTNSILVAVSGVLQDPSTYSISGTALNFSAAPPSGTGNISVRFLGIPASGIVNTAYRTQTEFTATAGQTTFSVPSYTVGFIDVYRNGALLGSADFTATNGTTVVLAAGASAGDLVETISFSVSSVLNAIPAVANAVTDTYLNTGAVTPAKLSQPFTSGTAVSASSTSVDFTSIPSWVKRVTVMLNGVSTNGTSQYLIQIGSGSILTSGYGSSAGYTGTSTGGSSSTAGFIITSAIGSTNTVSGTNTICLLGSNTYVSTGNLVFESVSPILFVMSSAGVRASVGGAIDRIRITTVNGTDTFDAGSINILYE